AALPISLQFRALSSISDNTPLGGRSIPFRGRAAQLQPNLCSLHRLLGATGGAAKPGPGSGAPEILPRQDQEKALKVIRVKVSFTPSMRWIASVTKRPMSSPSGR